VAERLDGDRDVALPRQRADALAKVDELAEGFVARKPVGNAPRAAAAEHHYPDAEPLHAVERLGHIRELLIAIDVGPGDLERRRQEQVRGRRRQADAANLARRGVEVRIGECGDLGRAELDVIEADRLGRCEILERRAVADLHA